MNIPGLLNNASHLCRKGNHSPNRYSRTLIPSAFILR